ncbi:MAG: hypothetical protein QOH10_2402 [Actinomycetota bacterium]|nr:hypothetical protein [Actinomycetota bacterium]
MRSGSRTRRSDVLRHSHAAPHAQHESRVEPPRYGSDSIGDASYGHRANSTSDVSASKPPRLEARRDESMVNPYRVVAAQPAVPEVAPATHEPRPAPKTEVLTRPSIRLSVRRLAERDAARERAAPELARARRVVERHRDRDGLTRERPGTDRAGEGQAMTRQVSRDARVAGSAIRPSSMDWRGRELLRPAALTRARRVLDRERDVAGGGRGETAAASTGACGTRRRRGADTSVGGARRRAGPRVRVRDRRGRPRGPRRRGRECEDRDKQRRAKQRDRRDET